ncbi:MULTISPECIES: heavy-metal-associated domain-containing protein [Brucella/Ochrobactrum group]|uniref:heavy-metal-associated domain-containing protein n=1 Tax=Brucella/Ochrobactrum group TaxID=2826938 RepID=UPI001122B548|nr:MULTISPECIES: heavy-metal-associated domain-containing protein [Brucella/Ochrobactrum group]
MMKFSIPKMKCGGCADNITVALRKLDATAPIEIDLDKKEIEFDSKVSPEAVLSALAAAGYPASNAQ